MNFPAEDAFNAAFQARLRETREGMKWSFPQMAHALGVKTDAYKKYESRLGSAFPLYLLPKLIFITGRPHTYWLGTPTPRLRIVR